MKTRIHRLFLLIGIFLLTACGPKEEKGLLIASAANVQFAMSELVEAFSDESGVPARIVIGSSGKLTAQIREGAPFDLFVSANLKYPEELYQRGLTTAAPEVYALGKLVLWTMKEGVSPEIEQLSAAGTDYIATANPKNAPYGIATEEVLRFYGIYEQVKEKLVFGESIAQTNQFILSGTAAVGFTTKSVVLSPELKGKGKWQEVPKDSYASIQQGVVIVKKEGKDMAAAEKFYTFLFSEQAQHILEKYGYSIPPMHEPL